MIALLRGTIALRDSQTIIIDVSGVGYKVSVPTTVLLQAPTGKEITLYIHTHVREDLLELYGFLSQSDLKLFELLLSVSGIGPKTALGVFSLGSSSDILSAITTSNVSFFSGVPRLGKKNAQKIIIELKNKVGSTADLDLTGDSLQDEVLEALTAFGFSGKEAVQALKGIDENLKTEEKVRLALKQLGK